MPTILSFRKKFVFIHIPKTAGTSITSVLEPFADPPILSSKLVRNSLHILCKYISFDVYRYTGKYIIPSHADAEELQARYPDLDFRAFFRFSFVRNPWDWMVSRYAFIRLPRKKLTSPHKSFAVSQQSFTEFVESICLSKSPINQCQRLFLKSDGSLDMEFIGKIENFSSDFQHVLEYLGISNKAIPYKNTTSHAKYTEMYDDYTKKLVGNAFCQDIDLFKYSFGK